jgi:hypothetical protein
MVDAVLQGAPVSLLGFRREQAHLLAGAERRPGRFAV